MAVPNPLSINLLLVLTYGIAYNIGTARLGVLVQLAVDIQDKNGMQVKDSGLQQRVQLHTRRGKVIVHAENISCESHHGHAVQA